MHRSGPDGADALIGFVTGFAGDALIGFVTGFAGEFPKRGIDMKRVVGEGDIVAPTGGQPRVTSNVSRTAVSLSGFRTT